MTGNKKYFIGLSNKPGEYILYYFMDNKMIYLSKYDNPDDAINALNKYTLVGTSDKIAQELFDQISILVDDEISVQEFILSLFTVFKYTDAVEFQLLVQILGSIDPSSNYRECLTNLSTSVYPNNKELLIYIALYDLLISVSTALNRRTLYDPVSKVVADLISHIMDIFEYEAMENVQ